MREALLLIGLAVLVAMGVMINDHLTQLNSHLVSMENIAKQLEERTRILDRVLPHVPQD